MLSDHLLNTLLHSISSIAYCIACEYVTGSMSPKIFSALLFNFTVVDFKPSTSSLEILNGTGVNNTSQYDDRPGLNRGRGIIIRLRPITSAQTVSISPKVMDPVPISTTMCLSI